MERRIIYVQTIKKIVQALEQKKQEEAYALVESLKREGWFPLKIEYDINRWLLERKYHQYECEAEELDKEKKGLVMQYQEGLPLEEQLLYQLKILLLSKQVEQFNQFLVPMYLSNDTTYELEGKYKEQIESMRRLKEIVSLYEQIEADTLDKNPPLLFYRLQNLTERYERNKPEDIFSVSKTYTKKNS